MLSRAIVRINNALVRLRAPKSEPAGVLVLIPACLQNSKCRERVNVDVGNCRRCGECGVKEMAELAERYGVRVACATGGRLALEMVKSDAVRVVVAVACEKELRAGIMGAFPKPVVAISNQRPNGPCRDTTVDLEAVRRALEEVLRSA